MSGADFSIGMLAGAVLSAYGWLLFFDPPQCAEFRKNGDGRATCMRYVPAHCARSYWWCADMDDYIDFLFAVFTIALLFLLGLMGVLVYKICEGGI